MKDEKFCAAENISVIIPYRDIEKLVDFAHQVDEIEGQYKRLQDQFTAILGIFSECLDKISVIL
jgi:hypothetical protein